MHRATPSIRSAARVSLRPFAARSFSFSASRRSQQQTEAPRSEPEDTRAILRDVGLLALAFGGAFGLSVALLSSGHAGPSTRQLRSDRYVALKLLDARRTCSPSSTEGDGQHVYLSIEGPSSVGQPRLSSAELLNQGDGAREGSGKEGEDLRILSVYLKEPSLQIERAYTPLYAEALSSGSARSPIELLIKRYSDGELGRYAHRLSVHDTVEVRGPEVTWQGRRSEIDELILIVGGTGITPAYQLITTLLGRPGHGGAPARADAPPKIKLLYAAPRPSSLMLLPELAQLQRSYPDMLDVRLFVDEAEGGRRTAGRGLLGFFTRARASAMTEHGMEAQIGQIARADVEAALSRGQASRQDGRRQLLVCGPDGLVAAIAGPKAHDGRSQGSLGGVLGQLQGISREQVWKL